MASETPYVETEALLAVMNDDEGRLAELLGGMFPGELDDLVRTASALQIAASRVAVEKRVRPVTEETRDA